jgi:hypothetical protein
MTPVEKLAKLQQQRDAREKLKAKPRCATPEVWRDWSKPSLVDAVNVIDWICGDCTPDFKAKMVAAGKCDWPCVEFFLVPITHDGRTIGNEIQGRRTSIPDYRGYPEGRKIIRIVDARKGVYDLEPKT